MTVTQDMVEALRSRDLRVTGARVLVLGLLEDDHYWSPEELAAEVGSVSSATCLSTIYRTLECLVGTGLVGVAMIGNQRRYTRIVRSTDIHLVCASCNSLTRHESRRIARAILDQAKLTGARVDLPLVITVTCPACQEAHLV